MGVWDKLFSERSRKLVWQRLDDDNVVEPDGVPFKSQEIVKDEDYIGLRINEMWLVQARRLWRRYYPMLHAFVSHGPTQLHDVVGPGQLRTLGERNLEKMSAFNHLVAGPLPHRGHELKALVGLYAIPGEDSAKALVEVVGSVAALAGGGAMPAAVAGLVKDSVDKILGLKETSLQIGVENSWASNLPLKSGYYVGMDTDRPVDMKTLWLSADRRLQQGPDPRQATWFEVNDYLVLAIERHTHYSAWGAIPAVAAAEADIQGIMKSAVSTDEKRKRLNVAFPALRGALLGALELTPKDAKLIAVAISDELKQRLTAEDGDEFTRRGGEGTALVADLFDAADTARSKFEETSLAQADTALAAVKF